MAFNTTFDSFSVILLLSVLSVEESEWVSDKLSHEVLPTHLILMGTYCIFRCIVRVVVFNTTFNNIFESYSGRQFYWWNWRKQKTCHKSMTNYLDVNSKYLYNIYFLGQWTYTHTIRRPEINEQSVELRMAINSRDYGVKYWN